MPPPRVQVIVEAIDRFSKQMGRMIAQQQVFSKFAKLNSGDTEKMNALFKQTGDRLKENEAGLKKWWMRMKDANKETSTFRKNLDNVSKSVKKLDFDKLANAFKGRGGFLGGFSGFVLTGITGVLGNIAALGVSAGSSIFALASAFGAVVVASTALVPIIVSLGGAIGAVAAVGIPAISSLTKQYSALKGATQAVNQATTPQEYQKALKALQQQEKKTSPLDLQVFANLKAFKDAWKQATAPATAAFKGAIIDVLQAGRKLLPIFAPFINAMNKLFAQDVKGAIAYITNPKDLALTKQALQPVANLVQLVAEAVGKLAIVFRAVSIAAAPLANWILTAINKGLDSLVKKATDSKTIKKWQQDFTNLEPVLKAVWGFVSSLFDALIHLGQSALPLAISLLNDLSGEFNKISQKPLSDITTEFNKWLAPAEDLGRLFKGIASAVYQIADNSRKFLGPITQSLTQNVLPRLVDIFNTFANVFGPRLPGILNAISKLADSLARPLANVLKVVLDSLKWILDRLNDLPSSFKSNFVYVAASIAGLVLALRGLIKMVTGVGNLWKGTKLIGRGLASLIGRGKDGGSGGVGGLMGETEATAIWVRIANKILGKGGAGLTPEEKAAGGGAAAGSEAAGVEAGAEAVGSKTRKLLRGLKVPAGIAVALYGLNLALGGSADPLGFILGGVDQAGGAIGDLDTTESGQGPLGKLYAKGAKQEDQLQKQGKITVAQERLLDSTLLYKLTGAKGALTDAQGFAKEVKREQPVLNAAQKRFKEMAAALTNLKIPKQFRDKWLVASSGIEANTMKDIQTVFARMFTNDLSAKDATARINDIFKATSKTVESQAKMFGYKGKVPSFDAGGVVGGAASNAILAQVQGGEAMIPTTGPGAGSATALNALDTALQAYAQAAPLNTSNSSITQPSSGSRQSGPNGIVINFEQVNINDTAGLGEFIQALEDAISRARDQIAYADVFSTYAG